MCISACKRICKYVGKMRWESEGVCRSSILKRTKDGETMRKKIRNLYGKAEGTQRWVK